jgi:hypothetical protein
MPFQAAIARNRSKSGFVVRLRHVRRVTDDEVEEAVLAQSIAIHLTLVTRERHEPDPIVFDEFGAVLS